MKKMNNGIPMIQFSKTFTPTLNREINPATITQILRNDCDVYDQKTNKLLLSFRKHKLSTPNVSKFLSNVITFARQTTGHQQTVDGEKPKTNIIGYYDKFVPTQRILFAKANFKPTMEIFECRFNRDFPQQYKELIPLLEEIDKNYKELAPIQHALQLKEVQKTQFRIASTCFTTVTVNVNFQTLVHADKGDFAQGFGNLSVIEKGTYSGGELCFPEYGFGVDVRQGDFLLMDVHVLHGNLPIVLTGDAERLSIVCYLRKNVVNHSKDHSNEVCEQHLRKLRELVSK